MKKRNGNSQVHNMRLSRHDRVTNSVFYGRQESPAKPTVEDRIQIHSPVYSPIPSQGAPQPPKNNPHKHSIPPCSTFGWFLGTTIILSLVGVGIHQLLKKEGREDSFVKRLFQSSLAKQWEALVCSTGLLQGGRCLTCPFGSTPTSMGCQQSEIINNRQFDPSNLRTFIRRVYEPESPHASSPRLDADKTSSPWFRCSD